MAEIDAVPVDSARFPSPAGGAFRLPLVWYLAVLSGLSVNFFVPSAARALFHLDAVGASYLPAFSHPMLWPADVLPGRETGNVMGVISMVAGTFSYFGAANAGPVAGLEPRIPKRIVFHHLCRIRHAAADFGLVELYFQACLAGGTSH